MEALKDWLLAVLAVSLLAAIAQAVMPEGSVKAVGRFACGLLVFLAVARPVLGIDYTRLSSVIRSYAQQTQLTEAELTETKNSLTEAWTWSEEGLPVPTRVTVTGTLTEGERSLLTDSLTQDLGLSPEQIVYADEEEP